MAWRQVTGIPMGFSCSPLWCNLYFVSYKIRFLQRLNKLGMYEFMPLFSFSYRYIDDLCTLNNSEVHRFLQLDNPRDVDSPFWIYPLHLVELQIELDTSREDIPHWGLSRHFLNVHISISDFCSGSYSSAKFDKRRRLPFPFQQFIQFKSNRPVQQSYNIVISQVVPILYMSSDPMLAFQEIQILLNTLKANGFRYHRLARIVIRFCSSNVFPGLRFDLDKLLLLLSPSVDHRVPTIRME